MIADNKNISPLLQGKLSFPFQGTFQEFLSTLCRGLGWDPVYLADRTNLTRPTWANYITPKDDKTTTPRSPEALRKLYDGLQIHKHTGKSFVWFYLFGSLTITFDPENPDYAEASDSLSFSTIPLAETSLRGQVKTLQHEITQAENFLKALHIHIDALSTQLQITQSKP